MNTRSERARLNLLACTAVALGLISLAGCTLEQVVTNPIGVESAGKAFNSYLDLVHFTVDPLNDEAEESWPRGNIDPAAARDIVRERAEAELRSAAGRAVAVHVSDSTAWTVVLEDGPEPRPAPLHRFVRVVPVAEAAS